MQFGRRPNGDGDRVGGLLAGRVEAGQGAGRVHRVVPALVVVATHRCKGRGDLHAAAATRSIRS